MHEPDAYQRAYQQSITDPEAFWAEQATRLHWFQAYRCVLDRSASAAGQWFPGGQVNACHEALDRHVAAGRAEQTALIYDSAMTGRIESFTFRQLQRRVAELAGWIESQGVVAGDRALIYMPLVPEAVMAMLACARLGVPHSVVFGGFGAGELAARIDDARPRLVLTASCGLEPGRVVEYMPILTSALQRSAYQPERCLVLQRDAHRAVLDPARDLDWHDAVQGSPLADCRPVASTHPLYILYTSGTTGRPKGIVRDTGGHLVALRYSMHAVYDAAPGDVFWAASDIGWVVGHSYIVYGPLIHGCTSVLYEGKPVGTPDAGAFWRVAAQHRVNVMFTAPTALRAIKREDPRAEALAGHDLSALRTLFLAGERADPDTVGWAQQALGKPVVDHWWQTETGWPVAANCRGLQPMPVKPGSVSVPVPGFDVQVVDDAAAVLPAGVSGPIAIRLPLPPGCLVSIWNDPTGVEEKYLSQLPGYYCTGDAGYFDEAGYLYVMGRVDDVINVAGHRLSTGEIEQVLSGHESVAECAVIAVPDDLKGQLPVGLVVLKAGVRQSGEAVVAELVQRVRNEIGPVACFQRCLVVAQLPKTRSGKILRGTMSQLAAGGNPPTPATIDNAEALAEVRSALSGLALTQRRQEP